MLANLRDRVRAIVARVWEGRPRLRRGWLTAGAIVVLLVIGVVFLTARGRGGPEEVELADDVRSAVISQGSLVVTVNATGELEPVKDAELPFLQSGEVREVYVQAGDEVQEGQLLASLDTALLKLDLRDTELAHELQVIALEELERGPTEEEREVAEAALYLSQARLNQAAAGPDEYDREIAELGIEMARNRLYQAQTRRDISIETAGTAGEEEYLEALGLENASAEELGIRLAEVRQEQLLQGPSAGGVATARAAVVAAQARLDLLLDGADEYDLAIAQKEVEVAGLAVRRANNEMWEAELRAPFAGTVSEVDVDVGQVVGSGSPVVRVIDEEAFELELDVDEVDIANVRVEQPVEVTFDALPGEVVTGRVERIAPTATETGGVVTYRVKVGLDETDAPLRAGMTATALITVDELDSALLVPNWAVRIDRRTGEAYVSVRSGEGVVEEIRVNLGLRSEVFSEVLSGLNPGDEVVVTQDREGFSLFGGDQE